MQEDNFYIDIVSIFMEKILKEVRDWVVRDVTANYDMPGMNESNDWPLINYQIIEWYYHNILEDVPFLIIFLLRSTKQLNSLIVHWIYSFKNLTNILFTIQTKSVSRQKLFVIRLHGCRPGLH